MLARPAVEAGESLGFLPGALEEKVDPYLRPLYDALQDLLEPERLSRFQSMKIVEVAPLAFMRGRTLNDAFIILDEAQNTTAAQMKMFLTRMGAHSKAVITGDITQTDLPGSQPSGLVEARRILSCVTGLAFVHLTEGDVVRNPTGPTDHQGLRDSRQQLRFELPVGENGDPNNRETALNLFSTFRRWRVGTTGSTARSRSGAKNQSRSRGMPLFRALLAIAVIGLLTYLSPFQRPHGISELHEGSVAPERINAPFLFLVRKSNGRA